MPWLPTTEHNYSVPFVSTVFGRTLRNRSIRTPIKMRIKGVKSCISLPKKGFSTLIKSGGDDTHNVWLATWPNKRRRRRTYNIRIYEKKCVSRVRFESFECLSKAIKLSFYSKKINKDTWIAIIRELLASTYYKCCKLLQNVLNFLIGVIQLECGHKFLSTLPIYDS